MEYTTLMQKIQFLNISIFMNSSNLEMSDQFSMENQNVSPKWTMNHLY